MQRARQLAGETPFKDESSHDLQSQIMKSISKKENYQVRSHKSNSCGATSMPKITSVQKFDAKGHEESKMSLPTQSAQFPNSFMQQKPEPTPVPTKPVLDSQLTEAKTASEARLQTPASALKGVQNNMLRQFITGSKRPKT